MQHKYPFVVLMITMAGEEADVNVHPAKMEIRFQNQQAVYNAIYEAVDKGCLLYTSYVQELSSRIGRPLTFCVTTFGCQMNARDSEKLRGILRAVSYTHLRTWKKVLEC